ncbi:MAG: ABC transporter permease, partial [Burkholderiales bacterium]
LGLLGAKWGLAALLSLLPPNLLGVEQVGLDYPVLVFTLAATVITGLAFGLVPALAVSRPELQSAMKDGSRGVTTSGSHRLRAAFVSVQIALALAVLIGAGLLGRSFTRLLSTDIGFNPKNLLTVGVNLPPKNYSDEAKVVRFYQQLLARVATLPGVRAASANAYAPFTNQGAATAFEIIGQPKPPAGRAPVTDVRLVDANYFSTLGIPLLSGRTFSAEESENSRHVVLINETLARKHFPGRNPIGQKLTIYMKEGDPASEVIGVVGDIRHETLATPAREMVYWPVAEMPLSGMTLLVRTANDPLSLVDAVRREVRALDPNVPLADVSTMERTMAGTAARA